jgi:saccharopine dehydrogenase-like NADP-dependent oxidoreductase
MAPDNIIVDGVAMGSFQANILIFKYNFSQKRALLQLGSTFPALKSLLRILPGQKNRTDFSIPKTRLFSQIELLDAEAKQHLATVALSVGLAPGLTNLLAAYCKSKLERVTRTDIFILLGLGEAHGEAALRWTIENFNSTYSVWENGVTKQVATFADAKRTVFFHGIGARTAYRFNFSDQHVLPKTLQVPSVSSCGLL